VQSPPIAED